MIRRVLIANRGEIAIRIIRACGELGIETVAVYSEVDAKARHVAAADHAVAIGPAPPNESYLAIPRLIDAACRTGADAVHPGYGFLSENASFAEACTQAGLVFVGPPPAVIAQMGSKIDARRLVAAAGVPVVPGGTPEDQSDPGLRQAVDDVGLPALIKASAGGGGKGMRTVGAADDIDASIRAARRESAAAFGDGTLYVERLVEQARHVEVQIFGDAHGQVVHLFDRDCSTQRRHQKVIEESPSPALTPRLRARITEAAVAAARAAGYRNAGTIEFLVDVSGGSTSLDAAADMPFYFLEMNTRLQVEHPVTEQVTGLDLVRAQLLVADGQPLPWRQDEIGQRGHAIEARIYAEDPVNGFLPQAGPLLRYREPGRPGIRVDSGVAEGDEVSIYYDPMIAKVIATAETRHLAITRLTAALRDFAIGGIRTNLPFLIGVLEHPVFRAGAVDTAFLDREAAKIAEQSAVGGEQSAGESAIPGRDCTSSRDGYDPWDGASVPPAQARSAPLQRRRIGSTAGKSLTAPMPSTVIKVHVKRGDAVKKGDIVVVLEAMKMELPVRALGDAVVAEVRCRDGERVQADATLIEFQ